MVTSITNIHPPPKYNFIIYKYGWIVKWVESQTVMKIHQLLISNSLYFNYKLKKVLT